jgi:hypoxanthine phosphoribosyltransferase
MTESQAVRTDPTIRTLFSEEQIRTRVREMGLEVARDLGHLTQNPLYVAVLKGACMFQCDLARATPLDVELDFLALASYAGTSSTGTVKLMSDLRTDLAGRHVVVCEGVVDSGRSVNFLIDLLRQRKPASVKVATLLDKVPCRQMPVTVDYAGWRIGSEFVVGYGMDVAEKYRNLPFVGVLEEAQ